MLKKLLCIVLSGLFAVMMFSGCSVKGGENSAADGVTFTDALDREVTVPKNPERAAAHLGSFAEVWTLAGGELAAAPDDAWVDLDLNLSDDVQNLGKVNQLSMETLLSAEPDFIIASSSVRVDLE